MYCNPTLVVALKAPPAGAYACVAAASKLRFRLLLLDASAVPEKPSCGSNCSSGGKKSAFFCVKKSAAATPVKRSDCAPCSHTLKFIRAPDVKRYTSSLFFINVVVCSGLELENGLSGKTPFLARKSTMLGVKASA